MNQNIKALAEGKKFRLELFASNMSRAGAEFAVTKTEAVSRRRELKRLGYAVSLFSITPSGGLELVRA